MNIISLAVSHSLKSIHHTQWYAQFVFETAESIDFDRFMPAATVLQQGDNVHCEPSVPVGCLAGSVVVSSPDHIRCVYCFQYNVQENGLVDIHAACIPQTLPSIWWIQSNCPIGNLNDVN